MPTAAIQAPRLPLTHAHRWQGGTQGLSLIGPPLLELKNHMAGNELGQFLFTAFGKGMQEKIREHLRPDERGTETESAAAASASGHAHDSESYEEEDQKVRNLTLFSGVMDDFQKLMKQETGIGGRGIGEDYIRPLVVKPFKLARLGTWSLVHGPLSDLPCVLLYVRYRGRKGSEDLRPRGAGIIVCYQLFIYLHVKNVLPGPLQSDAIH